MVSPSLALLMPFLADGGFLQWGSPNSVDPSNLLAETELQCIIVMPVYRLNLFGFLASHELLQEVDQQEEEGEERTVGNLGFWDQRLALEWTYENIRGFGGNSRNITLGGLSAGAYSVFHQLSYELSLPEEQAIIRRVVMYSNGCGLQPKNLVEIQEQFDELINVLGIPKYLTGKEKLTALRAVPWEQLLAAKAKMSLNSFRAVTDGSFVKDSLIKEIEDGRFAESMLRRGIRMMIGDLPDEASIYKLENPPSSYNGLLTRLHVEYTQSASKRLVKLYSPTKTVSSATSWQDLFGRIYADVQVHMTQRGLVAALARTLPLSYLHRYRINWRAKCVDLIYPPEWGVAHASDMAIWFYGNGANLTTNEKTLIQEFLEPFFAFIKGDDVQWGTSRITEAKAIFSNGKLGTVRDEDWDRCLRVWDSVNNISRSRL